LSGANLAEKGTANSDDFADNMPWNAPFGNADSIKPRNPIPYFLLRIDCIFLNLLPVNGFALRSAVFGEFSLPLDVTSGS
jgi:hypothetical protein